MVFPVFVLSRKYVPILRLQRYPLIYSSNNFVVLAFLFFSFRIISNNVCVCYQLGIEANFSPWGYPVVPAPF